MFCVVCGVSLRYCFFFILSFSLGLPLPLLLSLFALLALAALLPCKVGAAPLLPLAWSYSVWGVSTALALRTSSTKVAAFLLHPQAVVKDSYWDLG